MISKKKNKRKIVHSMLIVLSGLICIGAIVRIIFGEGTILNRLDETTLLYLVVAGGMLLLREAKTFSFGDFKLEFENIKNIAEEARQTAEIAEDTAKYGVLQKKYANSTLESLGEEIVPGDYHDDPWKGQFNRSSEANNRKLSAVVEPIAGSTDWYSVELKVESLSIKHYPLQGEVKFFLHPTFPNDKPIIPVGPDGVAKIKIKAWGAFTVGALADNGNTKLELDLSELKSAPNEFRTK